MKWYRDLILPTITTYLPGADKGPVPPWSGCADLRMYNNIWPKLHTTPTAELLTDEPWAASSHRSMGTQQWDVIASNGAPALRNEFVLNNKNVDPVKPKRAIEFNDWWCKKARGARSRNEALDSSGQFNLDWSRAGDERLHRAHALTHYRMDDTVTKVNDLHLHGLHGFAFLQAMCELWIASVYNLPIDPKPDRRTALPYGIYVYPDIRIGFEEDPPEARMPLPTRKGMQVVDDILVVVCVSVDIGVDPVEVIGGRANPLRDWWSYQPARLTMVGWETALWMTAQEVRRGRRISFSVPPEMEFVSPANDLLPPYMLSDYIDGARSMPIPDRYSYSRTEEAIVSGAAHTCFLPCNSCFVPNIHVEDGLELPKGMKPKQWNDPDFEEWGEYRTQMRKAFRAVDKAKRSYYGSNYVKDRSDHAKACLDVRKASAERIRRKRQQ